MKSAAQNCKAGDRWPELMRYYEYDDGVGFWQRKNGRPFCLMVFRNRIEPVLVVDRHFVIRGKLERNLISMRKYFPEVSGTNKDSKGEVTLSSMGVK